MEWDDAFQSLNEHIIKNLGYLNDKDNMEQYACTFIKSRTINIIRDNTRKKKEVLNHSIRWESDTSYIDYLPDYSKRQTNISDTRIALFYVEKELKETGKQDWINVMNAIKMGWKIPLIYKKAGVGSSKFRTIKKGLKQMFIKYGLEGAEDV